MPLVQINGFSQGSPNEGIFEPGDAVLRFGDVQALRRSQFLEKIAAHGPGPIDVTVIRDGQRRSLEGVIYEMGLLKPAPKLGISVGQAWDVPRVAEPITSVECDVSNQGMLEQVDTQVSGSAISPGSRIVSLAGSPVDNWDQFFDAVASHVGQDVVVEFENPTPGREIRSIQISLARDECSGLLDLGYQAELPGGLFDPVYSIRRSGGNPITAVEMGVNETINFIMQTYLAGSVFRGASVSSSSRGPSESSILARVSWTGIHVPDLLPGAVSVNLAVVNFLPLPIVDGGLLLNLVYEKIKGRPPSPGFQNAAAIFGLLLIGTVFIMVTYNDLARILG